MDLVVRFDALNWPPLLPLRPGREEVRRSLDFIRMATVRRRAVTRLTFVRSGMVKEFYQFEVVNSNFEGK